MFHYILLAKSFLPLMIDLAVFTSAFRIYFFLTRGETCPELLFSLLLLSYLALLVFIVFLFKLFWKVSFRTLFPVTKPWKTQILHGIVLAVVSYFVILALNLPFSDVKIYSFGTVKEYGYFSLPCLLILVTYALVGSLTEEIVYRGYIQAELTRDFGFRFALIVASLIFTTRHVKLLAPLPSPDLLLSLLLFGVFVGYLFHKTGSLYAPVSFHVCFNWIYVLTPIELTIVPSFSFITYFTNVAWWMLILSVLVLLLRTRFIVNKI